ncbi:ATP:cob(I)alamin adenosyltransferase [Floricoccus tropicus]|uniref:Corrinoid adenosyltransferase n=1 Tax=Floricoccus tropicus TaxID=1859473 RepID=A0A1E8GP06_9LACT|nr:cob(I)yrinic acid a,c-diamide adenosyltransferase [Floricoccus tropicus]OFI49917.1 ATP:cob(I)alamin adenosyltransferase [Floricoccus tropicus]
MKIYTKSGDKGTTSIIGGERVRKDSPRVSAYGSVDEFNSYIGVILSDMPYYRDVRAELEEIQQILFDCGTDLATPNASRGYRMSETYTRWLEKRIDYYSENTPEITEFILPGGSPLAAKLHYARAMVRRVEREVVSLQNLSEINDEVVKFLNRLSDYFYALARYVNNRDGKKDISYRRNIKVFH